MDSCALTNILSYKQQNRSTAKKCDGVKTESVCFDEEGRWYQCSHPGDPGGFVTGTVSHRLIIISFQCRFKQQNSWLAIVNIYEASFRSRVDVKYQMSVTANGKLNFSTLIWIFTIETWSCPLFRVWSSRRFQPCLKVKKAKLSFHGDVRSGVKFSFWHVSPVMNHSSHQQSTSFVMTPFLGGNVKEISDIRCTDPW